MRSIYERENFTTHHQLECKQISGSQTFRSTQESNVIGSDDFLLHHAKLGVGCKAKNWRCNCPLLQHRTATGSSTTATPHSMRRSRPDIVDVHKATVAATAAEINNYRKAKSSNGRQRAR